MKTGRCVEKRGNMPVTEALDRAVDTELRVRFSETDAQGIVYHSNFFIWFELGRTAFLEMCDLSRERIRRLGFRFVLAEVQCRYLSPACFDDRLVVRTTLEALTRRSFTMACEVMNAETGELLASGRTTQVAVNKAGQAIEIMEPVRVALEPWVSV